MSTKACNKCGWEVPITRKGNKCPICGAKYDTVVCRVCGKIVSGAEKVPGRNLCKECHRAEEREHMHTLYHRRSAEKDAWQEAWLSKIKDVPDNYPTLNETQWQEACRYFNGCARCGEPTIDSRGFFIPFKLGGRYCDWNIIPLCEKCAKRWNTTTNPFAKAEQEDRKDGLGYTLRDNLNNIIRYLEAKLNDASRNV